MYEYHSQYTIRRKFFKVFGASFTILDPQENLVGFVKQKAFKLKEDIRVYADESQSHERMMIRTESIIDFGASYAIVDSERNEVVGYARRKGFSSLVRDSWIVLDANGQEIGTVKEDSTFKALLRRFLSNLIPQTFVVATDRGEELATLAVRFNPFVYRMDVNIHSLEQLDPRFGLGLAVLLSAIEGRQD